MIASIRGFWRFLKESLELTREKNNAPDIKVGCRFTASDGIEYTAHQITHYEDVTLVFFKPAEPDAVDFIRIGGTEYPVVLDATLAPDEWRLKRR